MDELFSFIHTADMINDLQKAAIRYDTDSCFFARSSSAYLHEMIKYSIKL